MKRLIPLFFVVLLGFAFVIPSIPSWSAGTLKVTTPNGGNKWKTGKKYAIKWQVRPGFVGEQYVSREIPLTPTNHY